MVETTLIFSNELLLVYVWVFIIILAEWKQDAVFYMISSALSLVLGINIIISQPTQAGKLFGLCITLLSIYFIYLTFQAYGKFREIKKNKEFKN